MLNASISSAALLSYVQASAQNHRIYLMKLLCISAAAILSACSTVKPDYTPLLNGATARITLSTKWQAHDQPVIYHDNAAPCNANNAKLIAVLNNGSDTGTKSVDIVVPANQEIRISQPQIDMASLVGGVSNAGTGVLRFCQPVIKFTPRENQHYELEFTLCGGSVREEGRLEKIGELDKFCQVTDKNLGNASKPFYLEKKGLSKNIESRKN